MSTRFRGQNEENTVLYYNKVCWENGFTMQKEKYKPYFILKKRDVTWIMERKYLCMLMLYLDSKAKIKRNISQLYRFPTEDFGHDVVIKNKSII